MHENYMKQAIESAKEGITKGEGGPFGACVVKEGKVISTAHNTVLKDCDPTCHGEMNAIRQACQKLGSHSLAGCTLYTTAEPCPMCLAAIYWARIEEVYIGVSKECASSYGFDDSFFYEEAQKKPKERAIKSTYHLLKEDCEAVFQQWQKLQGTLY